MIAPKQIAGFMLLSLVLGACLPFPRFVEEPYKEDVLDLEIGSTTKTDVLRTFGEPGATYEQESVFVYTKFQETVTLVGNAPLAYFGDQHFLVLSFTEDGVLIEYSVESSSVDSHGCIDSGWCAGYKNRVLRLADGEQEVIAKQYSVAGDRCGIYLAGPTPAETAVSIDGQNMGGIFGKWYFHYWNVEPGNHEIAIELEQGVKESLFLKNLPYIQLDCIGGELIFVQLKAGWSTFRLELLDQTEGREQIEKRRLIVPGPIRSVPDGQLN